MQYQSDRHNTNSGNGDYEFDDKDDKDSEDRLVRNLLGIRGKIGEEGVSQNQMLQRNSSAPRHESLNFSDNANFQSQQSHQFVQAVNYQNCGPPVLQVFEPKFMEVYNAYRQSTELIEIDLSQHLMSLCLDHLVSFCCWARESTARCLWIQKTLYDLSDLRPEVRNGLCMIFVYALSAAKATFLQTKTDMFLVLQDAETGLGIVNKTSLKIYNDPYSFFSFLKSCMSGLIDAGKLPENERLNQA
jgi:hypothetical protein